MQDNNDALKRVRLWAEHGLTSKLSDLVAAVSHIDALEAALKAMVEHFATPTSERTAASYGKTKAQVADEARAVIRALKDQTSA